MALASEPLIPARTCSQKEVGKTGATRKDRGHTEHAESGCCSRERFLLQSGCRCHAQALGASNRFSNKVSHLDGSFLYKMERRGSEQE